MALAFRASIACLAFLTLSAFPLAAADPSTPGELLIATTRIQDPDFERTVVLIVKTGSEGVSGIILNHPTDLLLSRVFPSAKDRASPVYLGGPLAIGARALVRSATTPKDADSIVAGVYATSSEASLNKLVETREVFRIYAGYCGWTEQQLQREIAQGYWTTREARADVIFDAHPETLWERLGGGSILKAELTAEPQRTPLH